MRILQFVPRYFPNMGGVEIIVQKISESLVTRGIPVIVYSVDLNNKLLREQKVNGVLVKRFKPLIGDPLFFPELKFFIDLKKENADIIHVHNIHILLPLFAALFRKKKQKLLLQPHYHRFGQTSLRHLLFKLYKYVLNIMVFPRADIVIANSSYERRILREDFSKCRNLVSIPEGIDVDELKVVKHCPDEPKRILYVGALKRYKNVDKIVKSFAKLVKMGNEGFKLVIVGDGSEYANLLNLARRLRVGNFIEWKHGLTRQQLLCEYAKASVFILLSSLESFSRVVYEALLIGVPTIVLNFGATEQLVKAGFAEGVNSLNQEEVANALLKSTRKTYPKISEGPNTFLNWKEYSNKIVSIYHGLVETQ